MLIDGLAKKLLSLITLAASLALAFLAGLPGMAVAQVHPHPHFNNTHYFSRFSRTGFGFYPKYLQHIRPGLEISDPQLKSLLYKELLVERAHVMQQKGIPRDDDFKLRVDCGRIPQTFIAGQCDIGRDGKLDFPKDVKNLGCVFPIGQEPVLGFNLPAAHLAGQRVALDIRPLDDPLGMPLVTYEAVMDEGEFTRYWQFRNQDKVTGWFTATFFLAGKTMSTQRFCLYENEEARRRYVGMPSKVLVETDESGLGVYVAKRHADEDGDGRLELHELVDPNLPLNRGEPYKKGRPLVLGLYSRNEIHGRAFLFVRRGNETVHRSQYLDVSSQFTEWVTEPFFFSPSDDYRLALAFEGSVRGKEVKKHYTLRFRVQ